MVRCLRVVTDRSWWWKRQERSCPHPEGEPLLGGEGGRVVVEVVVVVENSLLVKQREKKHGFMEREGELMRGLSFPSPS